jgi:hypothetical protein
MASGHLTESDIRMGKYGRSVSEAFLATALPYKPILSFEEARRAAGRHVGRL